MKKKKISLIIILLLVLLFLLQLVIDRQPEKKELERMNPFETLPPTEYLGAYLGSVVLSVFKPIIVDYLWIKVDKLRQDRQYNEILALVNLIAQLQPKNHEVWIFNAWNMSYDISNQQETSEAGWRWVKSGIEYLQKGLTWNPEHPEKILYYLAHFYYHRIPQESYFMQQVVKEQKRDCYEIAEEQYLKLKHACQKQEESPYWVEPMVVACRMCHGFELVKKEQFDEAIKVLQGLADDCQEIIQTYNKEISRWEQERQAFLDLADLFKTEAELSTYKRENRQQFFDSLPRLFVQYKDILDKHQRVLFMNPIKERIETLFLEYIRLVYELAEHREFEKAQAILGEAIQNTEKVTPNNPKHLAMYFFQSLHSRFIKLGELIKTEQMLATSIDSGDRSIVSNALKKTIEKYEEYISTYRNRFNISREYKRYKQLDKKWREPSRKHSGNSEQ